MALRCGAKRILFTNNNVSTEEWESVQELALHFGEGQDVPSHLTPSPQAQTFLTCALSMLNNVLDVKIFLNIDSIDRIAHIKPNVPCFVRINGPIGGGHCGHVITCGPGSKFGVPIEQFSEFLDAVEKANVKLVGIHQHIGSGVLDASTFASAAQMIVSLIERYHQRLPSLAYVNFGGGLGVPYKPQDPSLCVGSLAEQMQTRMKQLADTVGKDLCLILEPGRFLVAESGYLAVKVNTVKQTPLAYGVPLPADASEDSNASDTEQPALSSLVERTWIGVDSGFNHLIRPMIYGSYHHITNVSSQMRASQRSLGPLDTEAQASLHATKEKHFFVAGNICESGDVFTRWPGIGPVHGEENEPGPRLLPLDTHIDDILVFHTAGAYGFSMANDYNTRPKPAEVLIHASDDGTISKVKLIRSRKNIPDLVQKVLDECGYCE